MSRAWDVLETIASLAAAAVLVGAYLAATRAAPPVDELVRKDDATRNDR